MLQFDFALKTLFDSSAPRALFQYVQLTRQASITSAAFVFDHAVGENKIPRESCAAIVHVDEADLRENRVRDALDWVQSYSTVVNVRNLSAAVQKFASMAG